MKKIDVLTVMDRDAMHASRFRCSDAAGLTIAEVGRHAFDSDAARAAVAAVFKAAADYRRETLDDTGHKGDRGIQLDDALARAGGAA